jgi:transposase
MTITLQAALEIIELQKAQIDQLVKKLESIEKENRTLKHQVEQLLRRVYGRRSEKMNPNQLLFEGIILDADKQELPPPEPLARVEPSEQQKKTISNKNHHGRIPIPEHLERQEIVLDVPEEDKRCPQTGNPLKLIGWEVSEKLEYRPGKLLVKVYRRPKYGSSDATQETGIVCASMPDHPIPRCKADVGLISYIIVSKFCDHLPLYRQDSIFEREGVDIPRATQTSWLMQVYESVHLLQDVLREAVVESDVIFTDDSILPLQVKGNGKVKKARLWVYVRGGTAPPLIVYDFSHDRSKKRPIDFLGNYRGYVHADAYSGYDELFRKEGITEVGCWVHSRRKFDEASSSRAAESTEIMARIAKLYLVEKDCADMPPQDRFEARNLRSRPIIEGIFTRLHELKEKVIPSEPLAKAINYALNQKQALYRYLDDGRLKPDNNTAENFIRPLALGRNYADFMIMWSNAEAFRN